ncbi:hypothetical protein J3458_016472 [Metarhizium acridum]|uniref:uncharacterized protein n=1 Tax=Metarhizium acridum TaxID=92637 RepID=UPI001C6C487B|nr:hypothetical protein J3458_016472 [Metarhizium acridum]
MGVFQVRGQPPVYRNVFARKIDTDVASCRAQKAIETLGTHTHQRAKVLRTYIYICLGCLAVSTVVVVMEAYALLALQFCDGEDLMSLYWSTWTMLQVGSLIAIVGVILALCHNLRNRKHP